MIRLDSGSAKELIGKLKVLLQEKSLNLANNVRHRVNSAFYPQATADGVVVNNKFLNAREWYEEFTGIDEVRRAQQKVVSSESKFITAQEARRQASKQLSDVQNKLREVYGELEKTRRGEDRYIHLITKEHALMKEQESLTSNFQRFEQEERENFSMLSSAVKESHEKERLQAERTKYWSIIGSILGTVLGVVGSTVNNRYKMKEFRSILSDAVTNEEKLELLISDKIADRLGNELKTFAVANVNSRENNLNRGDLSRKDLEALYNGFLTTVAMQEKLRKEREEIILGTALSAGLIYLLYRVIF